MLRGLILFSLMLLSKAALALTTTTVASSLTTTPVCRLFDGSNLDYAVKTATGTKTAGIAIYSGSLSTATWSQVGTVGADSFARHIQCSRDSAGTTHSVYNQTGIPTTKNYIYYLTHTSAGSPSSAVAIDSTLANAVPLAALHDTVDTFYVLFSSGNYYYLAYRNATSGTWTTSAIDISGNIRQADMVLVDNLPVVALYDYTAGDVIISKADATLTTWTTERAASTGAVGIYVSLDADKNGHLHLAYEVNGGGSYYTLEYASNASGSWKTETVDASASYMYYTDIKAITPDLIAVVAYSYAANSVVYFTRTSSGWGTAQTVALASHEYLDLGVDDGDVAVSYFDTSNNLIVSYSLCGDGTKSDFEECDDGNTVDDDTCTNECQLNCGDGIVQSGEECDDGNSSNIDDCTNSCKKAVCGDGFVLYPHEQCDGGDRCDSSCKTKVVPIATAGPDQTIRWKIAYSIAPWVYPNGSGSYDPDLDSFTFAWTMTNVPTLPKASALTTASIINATNPRPAFRPDVRGDYVLTLTITDADGDIGTDTVTFTVTP